MLASGDHRIDYIIRVDDDDGVTLDLIGDLKNEFSIHPIVRPRPITLGQAWNECVKDRFWDICAVIADKHLCLTKGWDEGLAQIWEKGLPAARWTLLRDELETVLILSRQWYDATHQVFPEWFPFWFSERWVYEVHQLAFATGIPRITNLIMDEPSFRTQNLRDLEFWFAFFAKSRIARIAEARTVCDAFGRVMPDIQPIVAEMRRADEWQIPRIPGYYETRGAPSGDPSPQYLEAKRRAEAWLAEHIPHAA